MRHYDYKKATLFSIVFVAVLSIYCSASAASAVCDAVSVPDPLSPFDDIINESTTPTLSWSSVPGALSYNVRVCGDSSCSTVAADSNVSDSQWQVSPALNENTTYWWQVQAKNTCNTGAWSTARTFTTVCSSPSSPLGTPALKSPAEGSTVPANVTLDWSNVACASTYEVQICDDSNCGGPIVCDCFSAANIPTSQWQVSPALNPFKDYTWKVCAKNSYGSSSWSAVSQFTTSSDMALSNGIPLNASIVGSFVIGGVWKYYYVDIPSGAADFIVDLYSLSQTAGFRVKMSSKPLFYSFDNCDSFITGATSGKCIIASPSAGRWWIGINSYVTGTTTYTVKASWDIPVCASVSLSPGLDGSAATGALGFVTVIPSSSNCSWTAVSNNSWITITSGSSGSSAGTVSYSVAANGGPARTGTIAIGGQTFTITQQASANTYFDTIQKIYIGYYKRPADPAGLIYWAGRLNASNGNLNEIIDAFANSVESQALYGTINNGNISTVVNGIYNDLFGRDAETGGLNYYVNGFNLGQFTPATIMLNVLFGAQNEDIQSVNNKFTAANLFTRTIDPEFDGANFQVTYAGDGDAIAGRNFLALHATSVKVPTQAETTAYIKANIANTGDGILTQ